MKKIDCFLSNEVLELLSFISLSRGIEISDTLEACISIGSYINELLLEGSKIQVVKSDGKVLQLGFNNVFAPTYEDYIERG